MARIWHRALGVQPAPDHRTIALTGVAALTVVAVPALWRVARTVVTIAHEGAHGLAALLSGRRLSGIRVHSDTSGLTLSRGRPRGPGMIATAFAGYVGPALFGLGAAWLLHRGHAVGVLWAALVLLALLLLQIRNLYGLWAVLVAGGAVFVVSWTASAAVQSAVAYAGTWFLLLAAPRAVVELQRERSRRRLRGSDADILARVTKLPALVWIGAFLLVTLGCLALGVRWIVP